MQCVEDQISGVFVRPAVWPTDETVAVHLLQNYATHLSSAPGGSASICLTGYTQELERLAELWSLPKGVLLLAFCNGAASGCVAVRVRNDLAGSCEMKRMWVEPRAQGQGVGRRLAEAAIEWTREQGMATLLLDTVPEAMPKAVSLYQSLGFRFTERHNTNDVAGVQFMRLDLS